MKSKLYLLLAFVFVMASCATRESEGPLAADVILKTAQKQARKKGKNVFIMWHASWCGWCHRMDSLMNDEDVKQYFDDSFIIEHMVVKENEKNKYLENPGAAELLATYNGDKAGIPFWVVLDKKGNLIADSFMRPEGVGLDEPGQNTGCPARQDEVDYWIKVLKTTTDISDEGLVKIAAKFLKK